MSEDQDELSDERRKPYQRIDRKNRSGNARSANSGRSRRSGMHDADDDGYN